MNHLLELDSHYIKIPNKAARSAALTVYDKAVLLFLASFSPVYPTIEQIQQATGIRDRRKVHQCLTNLRDRGVINWSRGGKGKANRYVINPPDRWKLDIASHAV